MGVRERWSGHQWKLWHFHNKQTKNLFHTDKNMASSLLMGDTKYNQYWVRCCKKIDSLITGPVNHQKRGLCKATTATFTRVITPHISVQLCRE